jgi:hypothetical protein
MRYFQLPFLTNSFIIKNTVSHSRSSSYPLSKQSLLTYLLTSSTHCLYVLSNSLINSSSEQSCFLRNSIVVASAQIARETASCRSPDYFFKLVFYAVFTKLNSCCIFSTIFRKSDTCIASSLRASRRYRSIRS